MQHNGPARDAALAGVLAGSGHPQAHWHDRANNDILRAVGLTNDQIEAVNRSAKAAGRDSIVQYATERGLTSIGHLLP